ncbi:MAG: branched-chain amino acid aminotransferase [Pyrinomonadaceae bacterium]|nr:branched-chain amino acid aminotransferase [Pyrinomonadaceae bacterium]
MKGEMMNRNEVKNSPLPPVEQIEFGRIFAPNLVMADNKTGDWEALRVEPLHNLSLHPAAVVLHYGQAIFEGMKAFRRVDGSIGLFRPEDNAQRFIDSAKRLLLPPMSVEQFVEAVNKAVQFNLDYVPPRPGSLYLRPVMLGTEAQIGVRGSKEALFYLISLPSGAYFKSSTGVSPMIDIYVDQTTSRAARGGTGNVKAAANYAITLQSIDNAKKKGCSQVLYLDAVNHDLIEEMGGMNIFFYLNGKLVTPNLKGTILPGVTRASVIEAAKTLGITVEERPVTIQEVTDAANSDKDMEAFACGTAATVVGIKSFLFENGNTLHLPETKQDNVTGQLLKYVQDIQFGAAPDVHNWTRIVPID